MAKYQYKDDSFKVINKIGDYTSWFGDFIGAFAQLFGVNLKKTILDKWTHSNHDIASLTKVINDVYSELELSDAKQADRITKGLENLIGQAKSPTVKQAISKLSSKLNAQQSKLMEQQSKHEVSKMRATALANEIDSASLGDVLGTKYSENVAELGQNLKDAAKLSGSSRAQEAADKGPKNNIFKTDDAGDLIEERI